MVENNLHSEASLAPELQPLLRTWRERSELLGRLIGPDEIVPSIPARWLSSIAEIVPGARSGFLIRACGYGLIRRFGRFAAGERVAALAPGIARPLGARLLVSARTHAPVVWRPRVMLGRDPVHFSELILPLSRVGEGVSRLLLAAQEERGPRPRPPPPVFAAPDWERD